MPWQTWNDGEEEQNEGIKYVFFSEEKEKEMKIHNLRSVKLLSPDQKDWMEVLKMAMIGLVCINIGSMNGREKQCFVDRIAGGLYALGGNLYRLTDDVYLLMPESITLTELGKEEDEWNDEVEEEAY